MAMVHISSLARNDVVSEVCDTLRAAEIEYSMTPPPKDPRPWLSEGLPEAIAAGSAFIHVEDFDDSFWSTALLQEAELAFSRRAVDPGYIFLIVRSARADPSLSWRRFFAAATVIYADESGWKEALVNAVIEPRPHS